MRSQVTHLAGSRRAIRLLRFRPWRERGQRQGQHRNRLAVDHAGVVLSVQEFPQPGLSPRPLAAHAAYHARLLARARRIVVDPDLAEDVVQEAFLRAWRACGSFDPAGGPMVNWLLVITARTAIDMGKARVRRPPLASVPADANAPADGLSDIDRLILRSELRDALSSIDACTGTRWSRRYCATAPTPRSRPSSASRPAPCGPGSTTG